MIDISDISTQAYFRCSANINYLRRILEEARYNLEQTKERFYAGLYHSNIESNMPEIYLGHIKPELIKKMRDKTERIFTLLNQEKLTFHYAISGSKKDGSYEIKIAENEIETDELKQRFFKFIDSLSDMDVETFDRETEKIQQDLMNLKDSVEANLKSAEELTNYRTPDHELNLLKLYTDETLLGQTYSIPDQLKGSVIVAPLNLSKDVKEELDSKLNRYDLKDRGIEELSMELRTAKEYTLSSETAISLMIAVLDQNRLMEIPFDSGEEKHNRTLEEFMNDVNQIGNMPDWDKYLVSALYLSELPS